MCEIVEILSEREFLENVEPIMEETEKRAQAERDFHNEKEEYVDSIKKRMEELEETQEQLFESKSHMEENLQKAVSLEVSKREAIEQSLSESRAKIDELRVTIIKSTKERENTEGRFKNYNKNFNYGEELLERGSESTMEKFMAHQNNIIEKLLEKGGNSGRRHIIDSKTEVFGADRKKDAIREWLFTFEIACENANVPKSAYITTAIGFTKGLA